MNGWGGIVRALKIGEIVGNQRKCEFTQTILRVNLFLTLRARIAA